MPKVSVIIPTYNRADLLPRAISSVLNQTFKNFELLIIDDGSTDDTKKVVDQFIEKDARIAYIWQKNSGGPANPRNVGVEKAAGEFIAFLDSDDEWLAEKLEKQLLVFEKTNFANVGFVGCNATIIETVGKDKIKKTEYKIKYSGKVFNTILAGNFIWSCTNILIKKEALIQTGAFDTKLKYLDDWDMWIRVSKNYEFDFVDYPLFNYYIHRTNITKNFNQLQLLLEAEIILNKHAEFKHNAKLLFHLGRQFIIDDKKDKVEFYVKKSFEINPNNLLVRCIYLLLSFGDAGYALIYYSYIFLSHGKNAMRKIVRLFKQLLP